MVVVFLVPFSVALWDALPGTVEAADSDPPPGGIRLEARVDRSKIPQNRTLSFTVQVSWRGNLEDYQLQDPKVPECEKLEIVGSASSNEIRFVEGQKTAVKQFTYILQPYAQGAGVVGPVSLTYTLSSTGKTHTLRTQAVPVTILETLPEGAKRLPSPSITALIALLFLATITAAALVLGRRRRTVLEDKGQKQRLEESTSNELRGLSALSTSGDSGEYCIAMADTLRRYIEEKWAISSREESTQAFLEEIRAQDGVPGEISDRMEKILSRYDVIKFAGYEPTQDEVDQVRRSAEEILRVGVESATSST